jgi:hypothetical protein
MLQLGRGDWLQYLGRDDYLPEKLALRASLQHEQPRRAKN